ncbi:glycosyltransferase [Antarcticibacterium flavum]|uniref:Glycosyltransferase n=1 Tax=Antarcticibacterium flavum TaxID=2058175 RepID=A0A5B7WXU4_9FLAO|nr:MULTISPECIES: glycosyltransferase [Antarcticibacterium]MCM4160826.1 glycosyl transferase [Antarcticibacterium sp. W02-3]QCY67994.1 glycosyltransferase [Antarcticibacterium flavum]
MKVVHFIGSIDKNSGGTAIYIQLLSAELIKYADLVVVTAKTSNPLELKGVKVYDLNLGLSRWWFLKKDFKNILLNEKPDVVHINGIWDPQNWLFQQACIEQNIKVLLSPHGMLEPYILKKNSLKKKLALALYQKKAIQSANYLHATAYAELKQIRRLGFSSPAKIIPNGIDICEVISKNEIESPENENNILFLSRIHPKKGIEILIKSISCLNDPNLKITIAGEGEDVYIEQLKNLCIEKEVDHLFDFVGGVYGKQKWKLYAEADFFVLPTYSENFGIVIIEALAAGVPVITTQGTPWEELVANNCGWWIDLSVPNLTDTIKEALALSQKERIKMRENGIRLVKKKYQIKAVAQNTFDFYKNIVSKQIGVYSY